MDSNFAKNLIEKNKSDYNKIASYFDETRTHIWEDLRRFDKYVKKWDNVLDYGCGNGRLIQIFGDKKIKYLGVDLSENLIKIAKNKWKTESNERDFMAINGVDLPLSIGSFDAIYSIAVFHHIPSEDLRKELLANFYNLLKSDGYLILTVWNLWQIKYLNLIIKYTIKKLFGQSKMDFKDILVPWKNPKGEMLADRYYHCFTLNELKKLVIDAGFIIAETGYFGGKKNNFNIYLIAKKG